MTEPSDPIAVIEQLFEGVWNGDDPSVADSLVAPDYYIHDRDLAEELSGPELYKALAAGTREIFPDMTFTIHDAFAVDDRVAVRWTMTGTHDGQFMGVAPTGREVVLNAIEINRFEDGQLAETWSQSDMLGVLDQLGAIPGPDDQQQ